MYARHDLAWLTGESWRRQLAVAPAGTAAHGAILRWADAGWPLVVRRPDAVLNAGPGGPGGPGAADDDVFLGLAAPPDAASGAKLRLPMRVKPQDIERHSAPLPLARAGQALPTQWRAPFARLRGASAHLDLRVFGSLALQALTGQSYLRDSSDIDLLFRPRSIAELDAGTMLLASHLGELPLDGEIVFPSGQAVAWKEWFTARAHTDRVLVKSHAGVKLGARAELLAELEAV